MAAAPDPDEVLCSTQGKANFQRLARLLIGGGTNLLMDTFDAACPPSRLHTILRNSATENLLRSAKLTKLQWDCLYPAPGVCGKSTDFDLTLLFRLLRTICSLTPPATGWDDLPDTSDFDLTADIVRIKYYRNTVYGHVQHKMEIPDDMFLSLWQEISGALVRIAGQISLEKKTAWQRAIDKFLKDPLTAEHERNVKELLSWYKNDIEVKKSMEEVHQGINRLEIEADMVTENVQVLQTAVREEAHDVRERICRLEVGRGSLCHLVFFHLSF